MNNWNMIFESVFFQPTITNQEYLKRFLSQGTLTKKDLLDFYSGEDVKDKYRLIEKEINEL